MIRTVYSNLVLLTGFAVLALTENANGNENGSDFCIKSKVFAEGINLTPYKPTGWDDKIVLSTASGTHTSASAIYSNQTIYLDWAVINDGTETILQTFTTYLYIDDILQRSWSTDGIFANSSKIENDIKIGPLSVGTHSFKLVTDVTNNISESNEIDNEYSRSFTIAVNPCVGDVNLIPQKLPTWDDNLVLSTVKSTTISATTIYDNQIIYLDYAIRNIGSCPLSQVTYIAIYVDGVLSKTYEHTNINSFYYSAINDIAIGPLTAGSHIFKIFADVYNNVTESDESDNEYSRVIDILEHPKVIDIDIIPATLTIQQASSPSSRVGNVNNISEGTGQISINPVGEFSSQVKLDSTHAHVKNELILKFNPSKTLLLSVNSTDKMIQTGDFIFDQKIRELNVSKMRQVYKGKNVPDELKNTYLIRYSNNVSLSKAISKISQVTSLEWVDLNYIFPLYETPNDPYYSQQWYLSKINASGAWDTGAGDADVPIGIIDTGVDWNHPDLISSIWINEDEIPDNGIDDDFNGYIDDIRGWDWVDNVTSPAVGEDGDNPDNDPVDFNSHGTHCAGLAAATTNNNIGIASISNGCRIMCLRAGYEGSDGGGYVQFAAAASAIQYAIDNGARVLSMSFGGGASLLNPVISAFNNNIVVCHAAGNDNSSTKSAIDGIAQSITVAATDQSDLKASFSNFGSWVDVSSPGVSIYSTYFNDTYAVLNGTSMATPIVAGLAGLLISQDPSKSAEQISNAIILNADNIDSQNHYYAGRLGTGRINAFSAINQGQNSFILIKNVENGNLSINSITVDKQWLSITGCPETPFIIAPYDRQSVNVNINWDLVSRPQDIGLITITSDDPDEPAVIVQVTVVPLPCTLAVSPANQEVPFSPAGSTSFSITSDCPWTAVSDQTWCTVTPSGAGDGTIIANYELNTSGSTRTTNITVTVFGLPQVVVTLNQDAPVIQEISLATGWNIMSFAAQPADMSLKSIVTPLITAGTLTKIQDEKGNAIEKLPAPINWVDNIGLMKVSEGYKIKVTGNTTLSVTGLPVSLPYTIALDAGWNIMGYPSMISQSALTAFDPLITAVTLLKVQDEAGNAIEKLPAPIGWIDNIHNLSQGNGYKVKTSVNTSLTINNTAKGGYQFEEVQINRPNHFKAVYSGNGLDQMNIYIKKPTMGGADIKPGDEIGVFDGDLCVGAVIIADPNQEYYMAIASLDDPNTQEKDGFKEGNNFELRLWDNQAGIERKAQKIELYKGYNQLFEKLGTSVLAVDFETKIISFLGDAYPNPSTDRTTFTFQLERESKVRLEIYNMDGDMIKILVDQNMSGGMHRIEWDNRTLSGSRVGSGVYFYRFKLDSFMQTKQLVIR